MLNKTAPICVLDFETGGFDPKVNAITEIAAITFDGDSLEEIARFECLLKPYDNELLYDPDALRITNISMDLLNNSGLDFKTFTNDFISFLKKSNIYSHPKYRLILSGHNIQFDIKFLQALFIRMNKKIQDFFNCSEDYYGNQYPNFIDSLRLSQILWGDDSSMVDHKLNTCIQKAGFELVNAHRAMSDVIGNKDLFTYIINRMRNNISSNDSKDENKEIVRFREKFKF